jgi:hypothetical protein
LREATRLTIDGFHRKPGISLFDNLKSRALNPQPLPPKESGFRLFGNLNSRALNPQPLPPKDLTRLLGSLFNSRLLNPQPLPPEPPPLALNLALANRSFVIR